MKIILILHKVGNGPSNLQLDNKRFIQQEDATAMNRYVSLFLHPDLHGTSK